ncbi:MAG: coproporphyrinogen dehydrogenase HemZ [Roseburia sp.]|nr:coproporphyrinogen dehydrogenase HemZ [Roseburia sp.]MCM1099287.1 coproporphyrinogen dehydrogenase HemZ [Ruminococcus flavefaciens]
MLTIELNRENIEYDVYALVKAFYPEEQVVVLIPESRRERRENLPEGRRISVEVEENGAKLRIDDREFLWDAAEEEETCREERKLEEIARQDVENPENRNGSSEEKLEREIQQGEAYSEEEKVSGEAAQGDSAADLDGKRFKEGFKRFLYRIFSRETGKQLPWGNLVGIRPTKIAYTLLEEGKRPEEILRHYQERYLTSPGKAALSLEIAERERRLLSGLRCNENAYSLYVGIPFCPTTCLYCSFTSYPIAGYRSRTENYIDCLVAEMKYVAESCRQKKLETVYIGGGTPTTLEAEQLERLIGEMRGLLDFREVKEFTVEAGRADSITEEKLAALRRCGVTRISVNPQTMNQTTLDLIGRRASVEQVEEAFAMARAAGFDNINMDLILGLPGEREEEVQYTADQITRLAPDSLTVHSLAIKRASRLNRVIQENGSVVLYNTEETMGIAENCARGLGMFPYYLYRQKNISGNFENVGYAKEGKEGLYNILINEEKQTIIALGAGSITKRVYPDGRIERCENVKDVSQYMERVEEMIARKRALLEE